MCKENKKKGKRHFSSEKVRKHRQRCRTVVTLCAVINIMIYGATVCCRFEYLIYYRAAIGGWDAQCNASNIRQSLICPTFNHGQLFFFPPAPLRQEIFLRGKTEAVGNWGSWGMVAEWEQVGESDRG